MESNWQYRAAAFRLPLLALALLLACLMLSGCATATAAILLNEAYDKDDPLRVWSGTVMVEKGDEAKRSEALVRVSDIPERPGKGDLPKDYLGSVDPDDGSFRVEFRWRKFSKYKVRLILADSATMPSDGMNSKGDGSPVYIDNADQSSDFMISSDATDMETY